MSSIRQVDANKRNGALSRGPTTDEGKRISRANAVKFGLSGQGIALSEPDAAKVEQRLPAWCETFAPNNEQEEWLVRDLVVQSVRLENCRVYEAVILDTEAANANLSWDDDRTLEAAKLLPKLAKQPEVASRVPQEHEAGLPARDRRVADPGPGDRGARRVDRSGTRAGRWTSRGFPSRCATPPAGSIAAVRSITKATSSRSSRSRSGC